MSKKKNLQRFYRPDKWSDRDILLSILILTSILLIGSFFYQFLFNNNLVIGSTPYYDARIAENIIDNELEVDDKLNGYYFFEPYHYVLAFFGKIMGIMLASKIIPFLCGIYACFIFYKILEMLTDDKKLRIMTVFFLIFSPIFMYSYVVSHSYALVSVLFLTGFYFLVRKGKESYFSAVFFGACCFLDPILFLVVVFPLFFYLLKKDIGLFFLNLFCGFGLISLRYYIGGFPSIGFKAITSQTFFADNFFLFGAKLGVGMIILILGIISFFSSWKEKKRNLIIYFSIFMILISGIFLEENHKIILNFIFVYYAAIGFWELMNMKWQLKLLRKLLFFMILIFTVLLSVSVFSKIVEDSPSYRMIEDMKWIKENSDFGIKILSHPDNSDWIEYYARRDAVYDMRNVLQQDYQEDLNRLFLTRNEGEALGVLNKYAIAFVVIDDRTMELVRNNENMLGLPFVMENSKCFRKVKDNGVIVWEVVCEGPIRNTPVYS